MGWRGDLVWDEEGTRLSEYVMAEVEDEVSIR